ncbi:putative ferredoxin/ferredoxin--NADP reductase [Mycolicibacterium cyprinidarum]|uniref:ferredoxin--NADP(+) reductase n=1 Tax=Mycolicibacterium cyprinidarum TaxID=2860311 RepID=A0ABQ4VE45_9MYCO|nr:putative ferredoxin/ferredoxin--NADP reductase [Mycolicibacterium sp. NGTWS0302]GJF14417.1 putative ferredoxin/ferredoxin--NADP reductase [Mycolicibacterium sp. NGTWSNA01]
MAFVITQRCCNDASCVPECPVDCIRPAPDHEEFATTEMLYIDPETCIDCGACVDACPVGAIYSEDDLPESMERYKDINANYFERHPLQPDLSILETPARPPAELGTLRVAIVGAGPAACYAAEELLSRADVEVDMLDRLPTPFGLIRAGVAPDHLATKGVGPMFDEKFDDEAFRFHLNVEFGTHLTHEHLIRHHHAVLYAVGAFDERRLDIPGEDLKGSHPASEFVAWYNGHPDYADMTFDLSGERAVIVGNGNVALDVARILLLEPDELETTDIADHALEALKDSNIREVVLLGRRGPVQASYSSSEFLAFSYLPGVDIVIDERELELDPPSRAVIEDSEVEPALTLKVQLAQEYAKRSADPDRKRIVFRYLVSPAEILGSEHVEGVRIVKNELVEADGELRATATDETEDLEASLVLCSIGFRGRPLVDLPFDDHLGIVPNADGRVLGDDGEPLVGAYVAGWIKRGSTGTIGTNKHCAGETVESILEDFMAERLDTPAADRDSFEKLVSERQPDVISGSGWHRIDEAEQKRGESTGRPRVKFTDIAEMVDVARNA